MTGPAPLDTELVSIDQLAEHPENYNKGDDEKLAELLRVHGQWRPAVVQRSTGRVLIGNTMLRAARDLLGWTQLNVHYRDVDDHEARKILAGDNRAREWAMTDDRMLAELLDSLGGDLVGTGYVPDNLDDLLAKLDESMGDEADGGRYAEAGNVGVRPTTALSDYADSYAASSTRFLALIFPLNQYGWVVERMTKLADEWGLEDNPSVLLRLIEAHTGDPAPDAPTAVEEDA